MAAQSGSFPAAKLSAFWSCRFWASSFFYKGHA
jgi:hypothetical protein